MFICEIVKELQDNKNLHFQRSFTSVLFNYINKHETHFEDASRWLLPLVHYKFTRSSALKQQNKRMSVQSSQMLAVLRRWARAKWSRVIGRRQRPFAYSQDYIDKRLLIIQNSEQFMGIWERYASNMEQVKRYLWLFTGNCQRNYGGLATF